MLFLALLSLLFSFTQTSDATECSTNPDLFRFKFGDFNVTVIQDGRLIFPANPFLVPDALVLRSFKFYNPGANPYSFTQNVVLLQRGSETILVDSGSGKNPNIFGTAGKLVENLRAAGVSPENITHVLLTHGHFDHIGGVINTDGTPTFQNAKLILSRREFNFWTSPPNEIVKTTPFLPSQFVLGMIQIFDKSVRAYSSNRKFIEENSFVLPDIEMLSTPGHTPGHMAVRVNSRGKSLFIIGDAFHSRSTNIQNPDWNINTDVNGTLAIETKMKVLDFLAKEKHLVLAYHGPFPGLGYVHSFGPFFDWSPFALIG